MNIQNLYTGLMAATLAFCMQSGAAYAADTAETATPTKNAEAPTDAETKADPTAPEGISDIGTHLNNVIERLSSQSTIAEQIKAELSQLRDAMCLQYNRQEQRRSMRARDNARFSTGIWTVFTALLGYSWYSRFSNKEERRELAHLKRRASMLYNKDRVSLFSLLINGKSEKNGLCGADFGINQGEFDYLQSLANKRSIRTMHLNTIGILTAITALLTLYNSAIMWNAGTQLAKLKHQARTLQQGQNETPN